MFSLLRSGVFDGKLSTKKSDGREPHARSTLLLYYRETDTIFARETIPYLFAHNWHKLFIHLHMQHLHRPNCQSFNFSFLAKKSLPWYNRDHKFSLTDLFFDSIIRASNTLQVIDHRHLFQLSYMYIDIFEGYFPSSRIPILPRMG